MIQQNPSDQPTGPTRKNLRSAAIGTAATLVVLFVVGLVRLSSDRHVALLMIGLAIVLTVVTGVAVIVARKRGRI
ncbi:MAG TPA: hypothetical protein VHZ97_06175 [Pseudonocardiaceae bacterium]|nr:hypothetical protein [Pseudonocardiaceae bacterium]